MKINLRSFRELTHGMAIWAEEIARQPAQINAAYREKNAQKLLASKVLAVGFSGGAWSASAQECCDVSLALHNVQSVELLAYVDKFILENGHGCSVETIPGDTVPSTTSMIRQAAIEQLPVEHPDYPGVGITISQLSGPTDGPNADWKNAVTMATGDFSRDNPATWTGAIDRCPCGTGTCAKMAVLHAKGELPLDKSFRHQGLLGNIYTGRLVEETTVAGRTTVVPEISGRSWIYGLNTLVLDHDDPFTEGFTVGDTWV